MKSSAIIRIMIWTFVALFFTGVLCCFIFTDGFDKFTFNVGGKEKVIREKEFDANEIDSLNIKWLYDSVYLSSYDGDKIIVTEKANRELDEDELFTINQSNRTLTLEQERHFNFFNIFNFKRLKREIKVPKKLYKQITANFTSGKLEMDDIKTTILNIKMTSGLSSANNVESEELSVDITSGRVNLNGKFKDITAMETSGSMDIETSVAPSKMYVNVTSGSAHITIPDNSGFVLGKQKTSGSFSTDFDLDDFGKYKNGSREYRVKITSGSVRLLEK